MRFSNRILGVIALMSLMAFSSASLAKGKKASDERTNAFSVNGLGLLQTSLETKFVVGVRDFVAITVPVAFNFAHPTFPMFSGTEKVLSHGSNNHIMVTTGVGARFFLTGEVSKGGLYLEPEVKMGWARFNQINQMTDTTTSGDFFRIAPGAAAGYAWVMNSGLYVNLGLGGFYDFKVAKIAGADTFPGGPGSMGHIDPMLDASLGYAW